MKSQKIGNYVIKCIKANKNKFGFGANHKSGHYVSHDGKGTFNLYEAYVYNDKSGFVDADWDDSLKEYYKCVPVEIAIRIK